MAQKKAGGSVKNGRDSPGKRLGVKCYGGEVVSAGSILVRQRGAKILAGENVGLGKDHTAYSCVTGTVRYGKIRGRTIVSVIDSTETSKS